MGVTTFFETSAGPLRDIVARLRSTGAERTTVEVKAAGGGVPKSLWPTVSAFSNRGGGVIILGLDGQNGFRPAAEFDPIRIRDGVADAFRSRGAREEPGPLTPCPTGTVEIAEVDGAVVVVVDVEEAPASDRPVYVTTAGPIGGSYERIGDGDHRLGGYGVFLLHSDRTQPTDDSEAVEGATIDDLDADLINRFLDPSTRQRGFGEAFPPALWNATSQLGRSATPPARSVSPPGRRLDADCVTPRPLDTMSPPE